MVQPQWPILRSEVFAGVDVVVHVTMRANGAGWSGYLQALEVSGETSAAGDLSLLVAKLLQLLADPIAALALCQIGRKLAGALNRGHGLLELPNDRWNRIIVHDKQTRWFSFNVGLEFSWPRRCSRRRDRAQWRRTSARGSLLSGYRRPARGVRPRDREKPCRGCRCHGGADPAGRRRL